MKKKAEEIDNLQPQPGFPAHQCGEAEHEEQPGDAEKGRRGARADVEDKA